ncbi:hypothetical protein QJQ45_011113 [Haematococcus lacustris]|nr:hypothetical protein QJQ45_011113 [Haematococcus lacustris]
MDAGAFALLSGGIHFDRRRFSKDVKAFRSSSATAPAACDGAAPVVAAASDRPAATLSKKRPRSQPAAADTEGNGIQLFKSSNGVHSNTKDTAAPPLQCNERCGNGLLAAKVKCKVPTTLPRHRCRQSTESMAPFHDTEQSQQQQANQLEETWKAVDPGCPVPSTRDLLEAANVVRKHYRIKVSGPEPPPPLRSWSELTAVAISTQPLAMADAASAAVDAAGGSRHRHGNSKTAQRSGGADSSESTGLAYASPAGPKPVQVLLSRLQQEGYAHPTPIQRQAVPALLASRELLAVAPTGSGKTLAFLVPILVRLRQLKSAGDWPAWPKAVVLSPTHELSAQQARTLNLLLPGSGLKACLLNKATATGNDLSKVDILLANPLRLATMVANGQLDLSGVRFLVLDEADKLFELGFVTQIDGVLAGCSHRDVVRALFSATLPDKVENLARTVLKQPLRVIVGAKNTAVHAVSQRLLYVGQEAGKLLALRQLLAEGLKPPVLVFVASKERAAALHRELLYDGVHVDSISAALSPTACAAAVDNFRSGKTWVLIATDLLGRGMDFVGINTVVNYDFPNSPMDYIHRVGRTGRANKTGVALEVPSYVEPTLCSAGCAITFYVEGDAPLLRPIANLIKEADGEVPDWMLRLKKLRTKDRKRPALSPEVVSGANTNTKPVNKGRKKLKRTLATVKANKRRQPDT